MPEPGPSIDEYLSALSGLPGASLDRRLLAELRDHLQDATAANLAAGLSTAVATRRALEALGPPAALAEAWESRRRRRRQQQRLRLGLVIAAAAAATILAAAQYADGRRPPTAGPSGCQVTVTARSSVRCPAPVATAGGRP
jgi:hypothetical protein